MGFLGGVPLTTPDDEINTAVDRFQPTFGLSMSTAFQESRSLFGLKPLQDLSEIAKLRGHTGPNVFGVNEGAFDLMLDRDVEGTPTSRMLEPDEANELYGIEDKLKFNESISEDEAKLKLLRKLEEVDRNYILFQNKGFFNNLATFGIEFVADVTDPIGLATLLFPVTSFRMVAKITSKVGKLGAYGVGGVEAAAGIIVPFTPGYFASQEFQYDFTPADYGISLAGGIVLGGALRRFLFMRDAKLSAAIANQEELHINASLNHIEGDVKTFEAKVDDTAEGSFNQYAQEKTPQENKTVREHTAVQAAEGKVDNDSINLLSNITDELLIRGPEPFKKTIDNIEKGIADLKETLLNIEKFLLRKDLSPEHKKTAKRFLQHAQSYLKAHEKLLKKTKAGSRNAKKKPEGKESVSDPEIKKEDIQKNQYYINQLNDLVKTAVGATGKIAKNIKKDVKKMLDMIFRDLDVIPKLAPGKLRDAARILEQVRKDEGTLTAENIFRALRKEELSHEASEKFLKNVRERNTVPLHEEVTSGDLSAYDHQEGIDIPDNKRDDYEMEDGDGTQYSVESEGEVDQLMRENDSLFEDYASVHGDDLEFQELNRLRQEGKTDPDTLRDLIDEYDQCKRDKGDY